MQRKRFRDLMFRVRKHLLGQASEREISAAERLLDEAERQGGSLQGLLQRRFEQSERLLELTRALNAERQVDSLLEQIVDAGIELTGAERGMLILGRTEPFHQEVARRFGGEDLAGRQFSRTVLALVVGQDRLMRLEDALADEQFSRQRSVKEMKLRSILAVPLRGQQGVLGALYVDNRFAFAVFAAEHESVLQTLADQAAVAIENARLREELARRTEQVEQLNQTLQQELAVTAAIVANQRRQLLSRDGAFHGLVGGSRRMRELFGEIEKLGRADLPVLIQGESGTGKELVARAIHACSPRRDGPFISENCGAIAESLAESELFGHAAGAFTGATHARQGLFELAQGGTLFLDEVAAMSDALQKKLLRVLQEGEVRPVGAAKPVALDVRVISAANQPTDELVAGGALREDLYFRLKGYRIELPPLRERREDIPLLVEHFLGGRQIAPAALEVLAAREWRGNVRELRNECRALLALATGRIELQHLAPAARPPAGGIVPLDRLERDALLRAISATGSKSEAARQLGITRYALLRKLEKYGIEEG